MKDVHGGDSYRNQVAYDFSINVNPLGMPKGSISAAWEGVMAAHKYPDFRGEALKKAISAAEGVKEEEMILGNGAAELIYGLCSALRPKKALTAAPTFQEYEAAVAAMGGSMSFLPLKEEKDFVWEEAFLTAITKETELLFLCNPNNPTGTLTEKPLLQKIAEKCEETDTWLCVDECFLPFAQEEESLTMKHCLARYPHLIVLRAFTKVYGMPGLRLGYGLTANEGLRNRMKEVLPPWNTSLPAQLAGAAAIQDKEYLSLSRRLIKEEKEFLRQELLKGPAYKIYGSGANFLFFKSRRDLKERLLEKHILIRDCSNYTNLTEGFFRIGVRTHEENLELLSRMKELF